MESVYYNGVLCIHYPSVDPTNIIVISRDDQWKQYYWQKKMTEKHEKES